MSKNTNTRVTVEIPTVDHKKLKMLAAFHGKTMKDIVVEILGYGLDSYPTCPWDHTPNAETKAAIAETQSSSKLESAETVDELFKKLSK